MIAEAVVDHAGLEARGRLAAPAELHGPQVGGGLAGEEVVFDVDRVVFLLGDRVADDRDHVAGLEGGCVGGGTEGRGGEKGRDGGPDDTLHESAPSQG